VSGKSGALVAWMRMVEEPEADRRAVLVAARAKTSVGWAVRHQKILTSKYRGGKACRCQLCGGSGIVSTAEVVSGMSEGAEREACHFGGRVGIGAVERKKECRLDYRSGRDMTGPDPSREL